MLGTNNAIACSLVFSDSLYDCGRCLESFILQICDKTSDCFVNAEKVRLAKSESSGCMAL